MKVDATPTAEDAINALSRALAAMLGGLRREIVRELMAELRAAIAVPPPATTVAGDLLNETNAARYIGFTAAALKVWRRTGRGPAFIRTGRAVRYRLSDLDAWLQAHRVVA